MRWSVPVLFKAFFAPTAPTPARKRCDPYQLTKYRNVGIGDSDVFSYFCPHGFPDEGNESVCVCINREVIPAMTECAISCAINIPSCK